MKKFRHCSVHAWWNTMRRHRTVRLCCLWNTCPSIVKCRSANLTLRVATSILFFFNFSIKALVRDVHRRINTRAPSVRKRLFAHQITLECMSWSSSQLSRKYYTAVCQWRKQVSCPAQPKFGIIIIIIAIILIVSVLCQFSGDEFAWTEMCTLWRW